LPFLLPSTLTLQNFADSLKKKKKEAVNEFTQLPETMSAPNDRLYAAVEDRDVETVRQIIEAYGSTLDRTYIPQSSDETALLRSLSNRARNLEIARLLLDAGFDPDIGNNGAAREKFRLQTPLTVAIDMMASNVYECDLVGMDEQQKDQVLQERRQQSAQGMEVIRLLLTHGATANLSAGDTTPLNHAMYHYGHGNGLAVLPDKIASLCRLLMEHGASVEDVNPAFRAKLLALLRNHE
jgi:hypothetical protein